MNAVLTGPAASVYARASLLPHDLSPWSISLHADAVVETVMVGLALASVATSSVLLGKGTALAAGTARVRRGLAPRDRGGPR